MCKKIGVLILTFVVILTAVSFVAAPAEAASSISFEYGIHDYDRDTVKITGFLGELAEGEDLVIPSKIGSRTVTAVEGNFGKVGGNYGEFILPDTVEYVHINIYGFSGTLEIPKSVTDFGGYRKTLMDFSGPQKLIFNQSDKIYFDEWYEENGDGEGAGLNEQVNPLEELVIGNNIQYFGPFSLDKYPNLKKVFIPDSLEYIRTYYCDVSPWNQRNGRTSNYDTVFFEEV